MAFIKCFYSMTVVLALYFVLPFNFQTIDSTIAIVKKEGKYKVLISISPLWFIDVAGCYGNLSKIADRVFLAYQHSTLKHVW